MIKINRSEIHLKDKKKHFKNLNEKNHLKSLKEIEKSFENLKNLNQIKNYSKE